MTLLLLALGCNRDDEVLDDSVAEARCEPLELAVAQDWDEGALLGGVTPPELGGNAGVGLGDVDEDGWLDAWIVTPAGSLGLLNDGRGELVEGFEAPDATAVALGDLDGDGHLDAWLGQMDGVADRVLMGDGAGGFSTTEVPDSDAESTTGSLADIDGDGDLDLFVARYAAELDPEKLLDGTLTGGGNAIYVNDGGQLVRDDDALPAEVVDDLTFLGQWIDADADGDLDLYLANDFGPFLGRNRLLENDGSGLFSLADDCDCDLAMFAMGAAVGDANGDGNADLFLTDLAGPDLLISTGDGAFYEAGGATGAQVPLAEDRLASWGTAFVDLDRDGLEDLPMVFGPVFPHGDPDGLAALGEEYADWSDDAAQRDALLLAGADGQFSEVAAEVGFDHDAKGRALAVGDLDQDGRADLVTAGLWYARTYTTRGGCSNGLTVRLPANGDAVGARLEVTTGEGTTTRWLHPTTTWSTSAYELVVGLGLQESASEVRLTTLDGTETAWGDVTAGEVLFAPGAR